MKDKYIIIIAVFALIVFCVWQQYLIRSNPPSINDRILEEISKLENKIDSLSVKKDSIRDNIAKIDENLDSNEKQTQELVNIIINQSDSADRVFIDTYIKQYIDRISEK